jgi:hypothetical protein
MTLCLFVKAFVSFVVLIAIGIYHGDSQREAQSSQRGKYYIDHLFGLFLLRQPHYFLIMRAQDRPGILVHQFLSCF